LGLKGIVFTLDSIIAFGIMVFIISFLIFFRTETVSPYLAAQQLHSMSEDILTVFSESKLREVVSQSVLQIYLTDGTLNQSDLDEKTIDVLGALWSAGKDEEAANIIEDILDTFVPNNLGYGVLINKSNVYNSSDTLRPNYEDSSIEISSTRIASGYEKYKPTEGYVARSIARTIKKNNTLVVMGDVITSSVKYAGGNNENKVNVTYIADIPDDATILDTYWFIEAAWVQNKFSCYMNGNKIEGCEGAIGNTKLESGDYVGYMSSGRNIGHVSYRFAGGTETAGDDGATHLVVIYNTTLLSTLEQFGEQHFQTVVSNCSINYKKPIFVLGDIYNMSVRLNFTNETQVNNVRLRFRWESIEYNIDTKNPVNGIVEWSDTEIRNVLNSNGISYNMLSGRFFWFIVDIDTYHEMEELGYERRIVGEDSYVSLNYSESEQIYNYIDTTRTLSNYTYADFAGLTGFYNYVRWDFNLTNKIPLMSRWQYAWLYSVNPPFNNPEQLVRANDDITLYHHDPSDPSSDPLIKEFARFGYDTNPERVLIDSDNKFELNFSTGYAINPFNSLGESTFLIPASVSYGDLFENKTDAEEDAIQRLENILGEDVSAVDISVDSISVAGVPFMWGPVEVRLRMWA
jgi:hypothetical protein